MNTLAPWILALAPAVPAMSPTEGNSTPLVMTRHAMRDKGSANMESHTLLAPKGWKVEGGAWWAPQPLFGILPSQDVKVTSPEGGFVRVGPSFAAIDFKPSRYAAQFGAQRPPEGSVDNGYPVVYYPGSLNDWQRWMQDKILPPEYPGTSKIRVNKVLVVPELTQVLQKQLEPLRRQQASENQQYAALGGGIQSSCNANVLAFDWSHERAGKSFDGLIVMGIVQLDTETQAGLQTTWTIESSITLVAPKGRLEADLPLLMAIGNSVQPTPGWSRMKADHARALNRIAAEGAADRSRILSESNREISRMIDDGWKERNRSADATHAKVIDMIRGVDHYSVAGSDDTVQLPAGYGHVYRSAGGEYLLTDDASFDPNTDPAFRDAQWSAMQAAR